MFDKEELKYLEGMEGRVNARMVELADEARSGAVHDMQVIIENTIMPSLKLLAEGQRTIIETLTPRSETEELKEEIDFLKSVIRMHAKQLDEQQKEIEQLKKAQ